MANKTSVTPNVKTIVEGEELRAINPFLLDLTVTKWTSDEHTKLSDTNNQQCSNYLHRLQKLQSRSKRSLLCIILHLLSAAITSHYNCLLDC